MFVISGVGAWLAYAFDKISLVSYLVGLPWTYLAMFIVAMFLSFKLAAN